MKNILALIICSFYFIAPVANAMTSEHLDRYHLPESSEHHHTHKHGHDHDHHHSHQTSKVKSLVETDIEFHQQDDHLHSLIEIADDFLLSRSVDKAVLKLKILASYVAFTHSFTKETVKPVIYDIQRYHVDPPDRYRVLPLLV